MVEKEIKKEETKKEKKEYSISDLPGVGSATAEKLVDSGYNDLMSIAVASPAELVDACGIGDNVAKRIINVARTKLDMGFESGEDLLKKREQVTKITTGSKNFDALIGGGVETGAITEAYGQYGSGKTTLAHQLAVNVQLPKEKGGAEGMAVWIDSESTLRPEFLKQLAEAQGLNPEEALKNFRGVRSFNSDHQMLLAEKVEDLINDGLPVKLIIMDSLMGHFRSDYSGRGQLADRQQKLNKHMHQLMKIATKYNIAIYITNQVMAKPDTFFGDPTEAIGGHVLAHASTYRIYLRRGKKGTRVAKLVDAPAMPDGEAIFQIFDDGIKDV
ncbi:MAG: DNA repair and recombination protein RadA [Candidatus Nanoarchaeia archaeon]|nr:DNA repair and recombination protein RadA [Candidatus Nanoarchaeia archaeon]